jgi:rSAM/selenodomain-associated transferase 1
MTKPVLFVFAKAPVFGRTKTRLAAHTGIVHAKRLYRMMVSRVLRRVKDPRWKTVLAVTPERAIGRVPDWDGYAQVPQVSGSLSPRLAACFARKGPTIVIGTDSPQIRVQDIAKALKALKSCDVVFGPAKDGGFWLIGANGPLAGDVFDNVAWSTEHTLEDVIENIEGRVKTLRTLNDIDEIEDLKAYRRLTPRFGN